MMHPPAILRPALVVFAALSLLTGVAYPWALVGIARGLPAPEPSSRVGQSFTKPEYVWGRLSATAPAPYTAFDAKTLTGSSGSNLAPSNPALAAAAQARLDALRQAATAVGIALPETPVPVDLVTASGSGLDPHLSIAGARWQASRVARARGITEARVHQLVDRCTIGRQLGVLGEPVVDVAAVNRLLDREAPVPVR